MPGFEITYAGAMVAGLLSFLSPCVLPLVPPYLCFLGGLTLDQLADRHTMRDRAARHVFLAALVFVLGFATVFVALGASASALGTALAENLDWLTQAAGLVIILLGLQFLGVLRIGFLLREARFPLAVRPAGRSGA